MGGSRKKKMQRGSDVVTMSTRQALREKWGGLQGGWIEGSGRERGCEVEKRKVREKNQPSSHQRSSQFSQGPLHPYEEEIM